MGVTEFAEELYARIWHLYDIENGISRFVVHLVHMRAGKLLRSRKP